MRRAYLALGTNMGHRLAHLRTALSAINHWPQTKLTAVSAIYETTPVGPGTQPYANGVVCIQTQLTPTDLLSHIKLLECQHGRRYDSLTWGQNRPLDIDIILYDDICMSSETLSIPHVDYTHRDYVLRPLQDVYHSGTLPGGIQLEDALRNARDKTILRTLTRSIRMSLSITDLWHLKDKGQKITALTAYDATFARIASEQGVECLLVGDTLGQVWQGHDSTVPVTVEDIHYHTQAVVRGNQGAFVIADMPFMSYCDINTGMTHAKQLMQAGAQMVKCEGGQELCPLVSQLNTFGVPVCVHLGLRPQSINTMGRYRVQGRDIAAAEQLMQDTLALQEAGAQLCVLECVPHGLAADVASSLKMPVIGIGAGNGVDGQILVSYDMLGLIAQPPRFARTFLNAQNPSVPAAVAAYVAAVKAQDFPTLEESYA